jgi:hypothetical protein
MMDLPEPAPQGWNWEQKRPWFALPDRVRDPRKAGRQFGEADRLIFVHMEKTAGSSVHESLVTMFPEERVCPDRFSSINERDATYLESFRLFTVHGTLHDFIKVPERRFFITFLRDPIARMISAYRYWSSARREFIERADLGVSRLCKDRTLPEFLSDEVLAYLPFLWNSYAQRLSGEPEIDPSTDFSARSGEILERALANLDNLDGVGLAEEVGLSFLAISNALGVPDPYDGRVLNVTADNAILAPHEYEEPNPIELNQETLDAIHRVTALDQVLYARAAERLFGQLRAGLGYICNPGTTARQIEYLGEEWLHQSPGGGLTLFGPYLKLPPSSYWLAVAFKRGHSATESPDDPFGMIEICCDFGERVLRQRYLTNADIDRAEGGVIRIPLSVGETIRNVETRFFTHASTPLLVRRRIEVTLA